METLRNTFRPQPSVDYVLFQLFMRDADDRMTMSTFTDPEHGFEQAMDARLAPNVHSWQLRRWNGERMVMQAVSTNWFTLKPKAIMNPPSAEQSTVVDGLRVVQDAERVRIYFTAAIPRRFDSHIKIYEGRFLTIDYNVTPENYPGFLRAAMLAPRYMTNP